MQGGVIFVRKKERGGEEVGVLEESEDWESAGDAPRSLRLRCDGGGIGER